MGIHYSQEIIEEVLSRNDIVTVVSDYVKLERKGSNYWGLCPFHNEKTPSFSVTPAKQIFYCFGCQKGGNSIHFISCMENIGYYDAVRILAEKSGINLPEGNDEEEIRKARVRKTVIEINTEAARFFRDNLINSEKGLKYFSERGISPKIIRSFGLGYAQEQWDSLYKHLKQKEHSDRILLDSGLVIKSKTGSIIDRYINRVMFPIFDIMGKVIAFGGRVLDDSKPKYINSPETPAYHKGRHLYAMNFAKKYQSKQLIIVEGYMDVISLHQAGINNAVASLGTALTDSQGRLLKKYCEEIIISYDADGAGQKAAMRGLDILNKMGCRVKVLRIPEGKDPDDFIKKNGADKFNAVVRNAMSLVDYKAEYFTKDFDITTDQGKADYVNKLVEVLISVENMIEREMYIKRFSNKYDVSEDSLKYEIARKSGQEVQAIRPDIKIQVDRREKELTRSAELEKIMNVEMLMIVLICSDNSIYPRIRNKINTEWFYFDENKRIAENIFKLFEDGVEVQMDMLLDISEDERRGKFAEISINECVFEDNIKAASDIALKRESLKDAMRRNEIIYQLSNPDITIDEKAELNDELKKILLKNR